MSLSNRVTQLLEKWLGEGEILEESAPKIKLDGVDVMPVNGSDGLVVIQPNHISAVNSSSSPLISNAIFTGQVEEITNYAIIFINVFADQPSATDGLCIQYSVDGVNFDFADCYTIPANTGKQFSVPCFTKYFRIKYVNGSVAQTIFRLQVKINTADALDSSHRIMETISEQDDARLVKAVITASNGTNFVNATATESGNLKITDAENSLAIAKGEVIGSSYINKWGNAPDFDTGDLEVDVWDGAEDGEAWELMQYIFPTTASIDSVSSSSVSDTNTMLIQGLDLAGNIITQTITLNGRTRVALPTPLWRVYRAYNNNGTEFVGHVVVYENTALTNGVPTDKTKIKAVIHPEEQQTEMAIYTIPAGKTGYLLGGYCSTAGGNKESNYIIKFKTRNYNGVFRTQQKVSLADSGTSFLQFEYAIPQKLEALTDLKVTAKIDATGITGASISAGFNIVLIDN